MTYPIQLLRNHEISCDRWDSVIAASPDGRLYATSAFLNCMAPGWMAFMAGDYEYVMPLPVKKKLGISYVYQPAFCQQLGVFGSAAISKEINDAFLKEVEKHFAYAEINMHSNFPPSDHAYAERKNYLLDLAPPYKLLEKKFSRSAARNISKAIKLDISIAKHPDCSELVSLHQQRYGSKLAGSEDLERITRYFNTQIAANCGHFFYAKNTAGYTIASSGYVQYKNRLVFLMNGNLQEGLDSGAAHILKARVINTFAGKNLLMDFEGSDTASFARFYEQYGAAATDNYPFYVINRLPQPLKWIKQRQLREANPG